MSPDPGIVFAIVAVCAAGIAILLAFAIAVLNATAEDARLSRAAKRRARALFLSKLDRKQRRSWFFRRCFTVVAGAGRRYTIARYGPFNIRSDVAAYCVAVDGRVPVYDKLLAQKLLVEADEQLFLARANVRSAWG